MAANRSARPFAQEEVSLLASLAAHAAVAIDNARLLQETRNALDELSHAHRIAREHSDAVERAALAHDRMTGLVLRGGGIEDVAAVVTEVLGGTLAVLDETGRPLVGEVEDGVLDQAVPGRTVRRGDLMISQSAPLCTLVLRSDDADERILERAALVCALLLLFRRSVAEAEGRVRGELLDDLISRAAEDPRGLTDRARRLGVDLSAPHLLVVARHDGQRERAAFWASSQAAVARGLAAARGQEVVLLLPGTDPGGTAQRVATELTASLGSPATAGAAGPITEPTHVPRAHREALRCAESLIALGRAGDGAGAAELGFVGLLIGEGRDVRAFVSATLGPVIDYDERRGTALLGTLAAYFASGGSPSRTAEAMHIHVNTVTQRLDRVARLLGDGWQEPERALEIQLALRLRHISAAGTVGRRPYK